MKIPFNIPFTHNESIENINNLIQNPQYIVERKFTKKCKDYFEKEYVGYDAFLTASCTSAMELIALSIGIKPGDEVIMPSYNFVGVANAFSNYGATLKFADIEPNSMNVDIDSVRNLISNRTKAIVLMHYSALACEPGSLLDDIKGEGIYLIEDNAQGIGAKKNDGTLLGLEGDFSCISFDTQKNISCSEGGVLLVKKALTEKVNKHYENGTNKTDYLNNKVKAYEWVDFGSKFILSEYNAAILYPLLKYSVSITNDRLKKWNKYYELLSSIPLVDKDLLDRYYKSNHNGHIFFIKCKDVEERVELQSTLNSNGINAQFHYTPLHSSIMSKRMGFSIDKDEYTSFESSRLLRLPLFSSIDDYMIEYVVDKLKSFYYKH